METSYNSGTGEFDVNMFDQYIYKRNESNLDVSLSVPHYNGQHGQHYNMNDHTSNPDGSFFDSSSTQSSSPERPFFDSDCSSSSSRSISPLGIEPPDLKTDEFFHWSSSDCMDVNDDNFFDSSSSDEALFSESSEESDGEELKDSGFASETEISFEVEHSATSQNVSIDLDLSLDEDVEYWSDLMTCNRVVKQFSQNDKSSTTKMKEQQNLKVPNEPVSKKNIERNLNLTECLKKRNRIGILECEAINDIRKPCKTSSDSVTEIECKILSNSKNVDEETKNEKPVTSENKQLHIPKNKQQLANDNPKNCKTTDKSNSKENTLSSKPFYGFDYVEPVQSDRIQEPTVNTHTTQVTPEEQNFGVWLPSSSHIHPSQNLSMPSQTIRSQHTTLSRILSAKKGSIIPQLSIDPFCSLDDIPARPKEIMSEIAAIFQQLTKLELEGSKLVLLVKTRATWDMCSIENDVLTRQSTPEDALRTINYHRKHSKQRFVLIVFLLSEVFKMLANGSCCTKRELYYRDPQLTVHQRCVDDALQDVCFLLKADLWELNVFSSSKGLIAGPIKFHSKHEEMIDCCNSFGTQIPADVNGLLEVEVDAELILIVEKDTVFRRLLDDGVLTRLSRKIIIVTSKGYPDVGTRLLLKKIWDKYRIPMYALVDADPFGVEIYCVYKFGSLALSHQASQLAVPQIQWLGLKPSHTALLDLKLLPLTPRDQSRIRELLRRPYIGQRGCLLERELNLMRELNGKAEIESLTDISVDYLLSEYLPNQLRLIST